MTLPKQKFREIVLLLLYSHDFAQNEEEDAVQMVMQELEVSKKYVLQAQEICSQVVAHLPQIDETITKSSLEYEFARIPRVERNILRLGVYELLCSPELPGKVALSEAVRLARKFTSPEGATFVNAVLDAIYHKTRDVAEQPVLQE